MTSPTRLDRVLPVAAGLSAGLVALPIAALAVVAATHSLDQIRHLVETILVDAVLDTLLLVGGTALLAALLGTVAAWLVTSFRFPGRSLLAVALVLPLAIPSYIGAYVAVEWLEPLGPVQRAWRALFGWKSRAEYGFPEIRSLGGAVLVLSLVLYPYVYLAVRAVLARTSADLAEVARTLGAGPLARLRHVVLPLARPGIVAGTTLVALEALNDIGASQHLGVRTLTVAVFDTWLVRGSLGGAAQLALSTLAIVAGLIWLERRLRRDRRYAASVRRPRAPVATRLRGARAIAATAFCALPVVVGFVLPVAWLVGEGWRVLSASGVPRQFAEAVIATIGFAAIGTLLALFLGAATVTASRLARGWWPKAARETTRLGYAVPGTVLALGLLVPLGAFDDRMAALWRALGGGSMGPLLIGSGAALVIAFAARFAAIAVGGLEAGLERVSPHIDEAAASLGAGRPRVVSEILAPLSRPAITAAAILVFVDAVKELPVTLLLRPLGIDTLATQLYAEATRGRFEDGALAALAIVAVGLLPVARLARLDAALGGAVPHPPDAVLGDDLRRRTSDL